MMEPDIDKGAGAAESAAGEGIAPVCGAWTEQGICGLVREYCGLLENSRGRDDDTHIRTAESLTDLHEKTILAFHRDTPSDRLCMLVCHSAALCDLDKLNARNGTRWSMLPLVRSLASCHASVLARECADLSPDDAAGLLKDRLSALREGCRAEYPGEDIIEVFIIRVLGGLWNIRCGFAARMALRILLASYAESGLPDLGAYEADRRTKEAVRRLGSVLPAFAFAERLEAARNLVPAAPENTGRAGILLSIIVPVYNVERYLRECIESVLSQIGPDCELICVDDGSTDGSPSILEEYAGFPQVTVIRQENRGLSLARNTGIAAASGRYLHFLDSDDLMAPESYGIILERLRSLEPDILFFNGRSFYESAELEEKFPQHKTAYNRNDIDEDCMTGPEYFWLCSRGSFLSVIPTMYAVRRDFLQEKGILFPAGIVHEDNLFTLSAMLNAGKVSHLDRELYLRRIREDSIVTGEIGFRHSYAYFHTWKIFRSTWPAGLPERYNSYFFRHISWYLEASRRNYSSIKALERAFYLAFRDEEAWDFHTGVVVPSSKMEDLERKTEALRKMAVEMETLRRKITAEQEAMRGRFSSSLEALLRKQDGMAQIVISSEGGSGNDVLLENVSDPTGVVSRPEWLMTEKGGGSVLLSALGKAVFTANCRGDGTLAFLLRGPYRKSEGKLVPFWLRVSEISIDGQSLFSDRKEILVCFGKPFRYSMPVKDGETHRISIVWEPARI